MTHHSLARRDYVATAEGRLATQASRTCTFTIGRAKSKLNNARGLLTVPMSTDHICRATVCKDGALIAHRKKFGSIPAAGTCESMRKTETSKAGSGNRLLPSSLANLAGQLPASININEICKAKTTVEPVAGELV